MATQRSKPYPGITLEEAIKKIRELTAKLGNSKKYSKDTFAQGLGYKDSKNGAFLRTSASLIQYNLINRSGADYSLTPLSESILWPTSPEATNQAMVHAAMSPQVFEAVFKRYEGQALPGLLANILSAEHGILVGAKDKAASIFRATMEYAGLLKDNKLVDSSSAGENPRSEAEPQERDNEPNETPVTRTPEPQMPESAVATTTLIKDFGEGRVATLKIPTDLASDEREKLANLIKNM